jgi:hypothetical protein
LLLKLVAKLAEPVEDYYYATSFTAGAQTVPIINAYLWQ